LEQLSKLSAARPSWALRGVAICVAEGSKTLGRASLAQARSAVSTIPIILGSQNLSILETPYWGSRCMSTQGSFWPSAVGHLRRFWRVDRADVDHSV